LYDGPWPRGFSEVAYHLTQGAQWHQLEQVMTSLAFIAERCRQTNGYEIIHDYLAAAEAEKGGLLGPAFTQFKRWFIATAHILVVAPDQTLSLAGHFFSKKTPLVFLI
jgi:hypothetical protein